MKQMFRLFRIIAIITMVSIPASYGADSQNNEMKTPAVGVQALSPELRKLLAKEMQAIQAGMMSIIPAYAAGDWIEIERVAIRIESSYILKQSITDAQVAELHSVLPGSFLEMDQQFHYYSGMLGHAAKNRKSELVAFYLSKMGESCAACHSQHATHRFPGFAQSQHAEGHSH